MTLRNLFFAIALLAAPARAEPAAPSRMRMTARAARAGRRSRLFGRRFAPPPAGRPVPRALGAGVRVEDERLTRLP